MKKTQATGVVPEGGVGCTCSFCKRLKVQLDCSRVCVCECDCIVVNVFLDNSGLGWLPLCQE